MTVPVPRLRHEPLLDIWAPMILGSLPSFGLFPFLISNIWLILESAASSVFRDTLRLTWTDKSLETWIQLHCVLSLTVTYRGPPSNTTLEWIHMNVKTQDPCDHITRGQFVWRIGYMIQSITDSLSVLNGYCHTVRARMPLRNSVAML